MSAPDRTNGHSSPYDGRPRQLRRPGRAAAEPRGRAVGPRRGPAVGHGAPGADHRRAPPPGRLLPRGPRAHLPGDARPALARRAGRRADARRAPQAGGRPRRRSAAAPRSTCWPARSRPSATSASTRASSATTRCSGACCAPPTRSRRSVHSHEALPRELVDMAERAILEVAHEDSRKDFRRDPRRCSTSELDKLERLSREGKAITGTASGFEDLDTITGGFQPGNLIILAARPAMGKSALMANFAENAALESQEGRRAVLARDVGVRARAALHRLAGVDQGRRPAQGQGAGVALAEDPAGVEPARRVAAVHRRLVRPVGARRAREGAPARPAERRRARADPDRLPAADARERRGRQPRRADRPDLARPEDARARARRSR